MVGIFIGILVVATLFFWSNQRIFCSGRKSTHTHNLKRPASKPVERNHSVGQTGVLEIFKSRIKLPIMNWKNTVTDPDELKVLSAMDGPTITWRTVSAISRQVGLPESRVEEILAKYDLKLTRQAEVPSIFGSPLCSLIPKRWSVECPLSPELASRQRESGGDQPATQGGWRCVSR